MMRRLQHTMLALLLLMESFGNAQAFFKKNPDANLQWAVFSNYEAVCKGFYVIPAGTHEPDAEALLRNLKEIDPVPEDHCLSAHRKALETASRSEVDTLLNENYKRLLLGCGFSKRGGGPEGCEIESRRTAGEILVREAVSK